MRKLILSLAATPLILGSIAVSAQAADDVATGATADSGFNIFSDVKFKGELRTRYQFKDIKDNGKVGGNTITNRSNLNFSAKLFEVDGFNGTMELNAVNDFGSQQQTNIDQSAERVGAKISQANISYTAGGVTGIAGRKTVNLDNQRFIGSVGWKQNFQTFDLAAIAYGIGDFSILGAYVYGVNAIGDEGHNYGHNTNADKYAGGVKSGRTNSALLNASYKIMDPIKLTGYAYLLGSASDTFGLAATGKIAASDSIKLNYRAEFAMQQKASLQTFADGVVNPAPSGHENSVYGDATYYNLDLGANFSGILAGLNYEYLSGVSLTADATTSKTAFQTPLATKHKFNGWADQFLGTPNGGLQDFNARLGYKSAGFGKLIGVYHMFSSAEDMNAAGVDAGTATGTSSDLGSEIDVAYSNKIPGVNGLTGLLKGAFYMGGDTEQGTGVKVKTWKNDQTMVWVQLDYKFATK